MPSTQPTNRSLHRLVALGGALLVVLTAVAPAAAAAPVASAATAAAFDAPPATTAAFDAPPAITAAAAAPTATAAPPVAPEEVDCAGPSSPTTAADARAAATAADGHAASTPPPVPDETRDLDVSLGDVAVVPLSVPVGANATVTVGDAGGYAAELRLDDDGDGGVTLLVNTYLAANGSTVVPGTFRAPGDDAVTVVDRDAGAPLEPGTYTVTVRWGGRTVAERDLTVTGPSVSGVDVFRSGPGLFDAANASAIRRANRSGRVRPLAPAEYAPAAVRGETLLVRFDVPGLLGAVAAQPGATTTDRFLALHEATGPETPAEFEFWGPCGGIMFPETVELGGGRVVADYRGGAVYVLLDTDDLRGIPQGSASLRIGPESPLAGAERTLRAEFQVEDRRVSVDGVAPVSLDDGASVEIAGETNYPAGTRIPVVVESRVDPGFERRTTAAVREDGSYAATVDLSNASDPGLFTVTVAGERFPAEVGDPPPVYWELAGTEDVDAVDHLWIDQLRLPSGGFLVAYEYDREAGRFDATGASRVGADALAVDPIEGGRYLLVVAHRDGDGDDGFDGPGTDPPYRVGGRVVGEWVGITANGTDPPPAPPSASVERAVTSTPTPTPTASPTATRTPVTATATSPEPTPAVTTPARSTTTPGRSTRTVPGFGPGLALLAVTWAAGLAARRRAH